MPAQSSPNPNAVGTSTDGEEGDGAEGSAEKTRGYGNGNKDGSLGREVCASVVKRIKSQPQEATAKSEILNSKIYAPSAGFEAVKKAGSPPIQTYDFRTGTGDPKVQTPNPNP